MEDHVFSFGFALYLCAANKLRFHNNAEQVALRKSRGQSHPEKPEWFELSNEEWFDRYMASAAVLGLALPLVRGQSHPEKPDWFELSNEEWFDRYMASAAVLGLALPLVVQVLAPLPMAQAAAPHLYLLFFQILIELMGNGPRFHPMLQVAVLIGYSLYRLAFLKHWLLAAWRLADGGSSAASATAHFGLALANAIFWTYNTFVMLLLRILPSCLDGDIFPDVSISWKWHLLPVVVDKSDGLPPKSHTD